MNALKRDGFFVHNFDPFVESSQQVVTRTL